MKKWSEIIVLAGLMAACGTPINYNYLVEAESMVSKTDIFINLDGRLELEELRNNETFSFSFERSEPSTLLLTFQNPTSETDTISLHFFQDGRLLISERLPLRAGGKVTWRSEVNND